MPLWHPPRDVAIVHAATTQFEAIAIRDLLEGEGIPVMVRSRLLPGYEVVTPLGSEGGVWADILVLPAHEEEARRLIADYLASLKAAEGETPVPEEGSSS